MSKFIQPGFPVARLRRLRKTASLRDMFRETSLSPADFIYPLFIVEGEMFWGHDRIPLLKEKLAAMGLQK